MDRSKVHARRCESGDGQVDGGLNREGGHEEIADAKQGRAAKKEQRPVGECEAHPHSPAGHATAAASRRAKEAKGREAAPGTVRASSSLTRPTTLRRRGLRPLGVAVFRSPTPRCRLSDQFHGFQHGSEPVTGGQQRLLRPCYRRCRTTTSDHRSTGRTRSWTTTATSLWRPTNAGRTRLRRQFRRRRAAGNRRAAGRRLRGRIEGPRSGERRQGYHDRRAGAERPAPPPHRAAPPPRRSCCSSRSACAPTG